MRVVNVFIAVLPALSDQTNKGTAVLDDNGKAVSLDPKIFKGKIENFVQNSKTNMNGVMVNFIHRFHFKYYELQTGVAITEQSVSCGTWTTLRQKNDEVCLALNYLLCEE